MVTYNKLFHLLIEKEVPISELSEIFGFSANIMTRIKRNQYIYIIRKYRNDMHSFVLQC